MRGTMAALEAQQVAPLPQNLRIAADPGREGRLQGLFEDLFTTMAASRQFEARVSAVRDSTNDPVAFRQALWLLMKVEKIDELRRPIIMERAMRWYRARQALGRSPATSWGKAMVKLAMAHLGGSDT